MFKTNKIEMTKKHRILFKLWKIVMWVIGMRVGMKVKMIGYEKEQIWTINGLHGDSITKDKFNFYFSVGGGPTQGGDPRFYTWGGYPLRDLIKYGEFPQKRWLALIYPESKWV